LKADVNKNPIRKFPEVLNILSAVLLRMWFVFMLLACPFTNAFDLLPKMNVRSARPRYFNSERLFQKPPDPDNTFYYTNCIDKMNREKCLKRSMSVLTQEDFLQCVPSSTIAENDDIGCSFVAAQNTNALSDQEIQQLRTVLSNLQIPSVPDDPDGGFDIVMDSGTT